MHSIEASRVKRMAVGRGWSWAVGLLLVVLVVGCGQQRMAVHPLHLDEVGPTSADEAFAAAELVVVGEVLSTDGGARFFGGGDEEDPHQGPWFEDVTLTVRVDDVLKGDVAAETIGIQWPAYVVAEPSSSHRIAELDVQGVKMASAVGHRFLFFLSAQGVFGLTGVSLGSGVAEVQGDVFQGQIAEALSALDGTSLEDFRARHSPNGNG